MFPPNHILAIAIGGALGSVLRYVLATSVQNILGRDFPYGTLLVNLVGCLAMGVLFTVFLERAMHESVWRAGLVIGVLGGFTTFSAFSMETVLLLAEGAYGRAAMYITASVILCVGATVVGVRLAKFI